MFRDWLKTHPEDREIYAASLEAGETGHQYNARKNDFWTTAHHTPHLISELAKSTTSRGIRVLIAAAGGTAALPDILAPKTTVPIIGVPVKATHLDSVDSLHNIVQIPRSYPVATVGINNSTNAALLAVRILGTSNNKYRQAIAAFIDSIYIKVETKAARLSKIGWKAYLEK